MQWLKTWLMKWLGVEEIRKENAELVLRLDVAESLRKDLVRQVGIVNSDVVATVELKIGFLRTELIDIVKAGDRDGQRIAELETLVKDATLDTALAALEDRVAKLESTPAPANQQHGRRGGSAWVSHQVAASAGAALANGVDVPMPTPGVS